MIFFETMLYDSKAAQHKGLSWMTKEKTARARTILCMAVPPVQRSEHAAPGPPGLP